MKKKKSIATKTIALILKKQLEFAAESAGSMISYQPIVPKGLETFEKKC